MSNCTQGVRCPEGFVSPQSSRDKAGGGDPKLKEREAGAGGEEARVALRLCSVGCDGDALHCRTARVRREVGRAPRFRAAVFSFGGFRGDFLSSIVTQD